MKINWINRHSIQVLLMMACLLISIGCFSQFGYIKIKAYVAQILLDAAWQKTQDQYQISGDMDNVLMNKPWPWADVFPVGKLTVPRLNMSYVILDNDSGQALAFGPGLSGVSNKSTIDSSTTQVISGHRDSHFEFLADIVIGDKLLYQSPSGQVASLIINNFIIIDTRIEEIYLPDNKESYLSGLVLITCYPFNSATASTPFRLVVEASEMDENFL